MLRRLLFPLLGDDDGGGDDEGGDVPCDEVEVGGAFGDGAGDGEDGQRVGGEEIFPLQVFGFVLGPEFQHRGDDGDDEDGHGGVAVAAVEDQHGLHDGGAGEEEEGQGIVVDEHFAAAQGGERGGGAGLGGRFFAGEQRVGAADDEDGEDGLQSQVHDRVQDQPVVVEHGERAGAGD